MPDSPKQKGGLLYKRIEDFTPGIHYDTGLANPAVIPGSADGAIGDYPPGSADPYATYNCIARPTGGLAPLAQMTQKFTNSLVAQAVEILNVVPISSGQTNITFAGAGPSFTSGSNVLLAGIVMTGATAPSGEYAVTLVSGNTFSIVYNATGGTYVSGGTATAVVAITGVTPGFPTQITFPGTQILFTSGQVVNIGGISMTGVAAPSGNFAVTPVSGNTYSIQYSTVGGTYVSGGYGYGNLGTTPFVGMLSVHAQSAFPLYPLEAVAEFEYDDGTTHFSNAWSFTVDGYTVGLGAYNNIVSLNGFSGGPNYFGCPFPSWTRMATSNPTTTPGGPLVAFPMTADPGYTGVVTLYCYPSPQNPTGYPAYNLSAGIGAATGQLTTHQNRVLTFGVVDFSWTDLGFATNEVLNFTDPPNGDILINAETFFGIEEPFGYGCAGSINAGELFLVKIRGGGLVVSGDVVSPTVTYYEGIQATGFYGKCDSGPGGLFYGSNKQGYWQWNGGNVSTKISNQLDNGFFEVPSLPPAGPGQATNFGFFSQCVGDKVYVSNNWVYDTVTGGWWTYFPRPGQDPNNTGYNLYWYENLDGNTQFASPLWTTNVDTSWLFQFEQNTPVTYWSWKSNPIRVSEDRFIDVREVLFRLSSFGGSTAPIVNVEVFSGGNVVGSVTTESGQITPTPTTIRCPIGPGVTAGTEPYAAQDITIKVYATDTTAAPILHWIDIGYRERMHIPTTAVPN